MSQPKGQLLSLIIGKVAALVATLLMPILLTRFLTMEEYGLYGQFYTLLLFAVGIASMGLHTSLYFLLPLKESNEQKNTTLQTFGLLVVMALLAICIFKIPIIFNSLLLNSGMNNYFIYLAVALLLSIPIEIMQPLYIVHNEKKLSLFYPFCVVILKTICIVGFTLYDDSITSVFRGVLLASFLTFSFVLYYVYLKVKNIQLTINFHEIKKQLAYSFPFGLAVALKFISLRFDKIISVSVLTSMQYAIYIIAYYGIPGINEIFDSLAQIYTVKITKLFKENNFDSIREEYRSLTAKTLSYTIPMVLIICLYADQIIKLLFSEKYLSATPYFRIYLGTVLLTALGAGLILRATDNTKSTLQAYFISSVLSIPITYLLIRNFALYGAITGAVIGSFIPTVLLLRREMKVINTTIFTHFDWSKIRVIFLVSIFTFLPFFAIAIYFTTPLFFTIFLGLCYLLLVAFFQIKYDVFVFKQEIVEDKKIALIIKLREILKLRKYDTTL